MDPAELLIRQLQGKFRWGSGSPEAVVTAKVGVLYLRDDGGAATTLYVKEQDNIGGDPSKGWAAK